MPPAEDADFVYIYTSGTTGLPKPCRVSHERAIMAGAGFGSLMFRFEPGDVLYCVLPLYHSSALLLGLGAAVITRTPMALRSSFSAHAFWPDVVRYGATAILYIGELCRYLLATETCREEHLHRVRVAVGNGLRPDVWTPFAERFRIPEIREFYGATEAPGILLNLSGKPGAIGHLPLAGRPLFELARYDADAGELARDGDGFCVHAGPEEPGELLVRIADEPISPLTEYRGYTDEHASKKKELFDVFRAGDHFYRTGDLLRVDAQGFFYFVDRIGDTYRWKGENVSTAEVADVLAD
ncbi:MAG: AMP-binding protein, partial [Deltaproteobacteria bacterium]|nr:AMP-binding protein [Deltaproteobacteria bacterium]